MKMNIYKLSRLGFMLSLIILGSGFFISGCSQNTSKAPGDENKVVQKQIETVAITKGQIEEIQVDEFKAMVDDGKTFELLDVRTPQEWATGIAEGAQKINIHDADFKQQLEKLDKSKEYVVICRSGGRSGRACTIMSDMGFSKVYNVMGGMNAWSSKGYPVEK